MRGGSANDVEASTGATAEAMRHRRLREPARSPAPGTSIADGLRAVIGLRDGDGIEPARPVRWRRPPVGRGAQKRSVDTVGIQDEVRKLVNSESARHKRLVEYVVRQVSQGRTLDDVLGDPYITNRINELEQRALLDEPEVVEAVSDDVINDMRRRLESTLGG